MSHSRLAFAILFAHLLISTSPWSVRAQTIEDIDLFIVDTLPRGGNIGAEIEIPGDRSSNPKIYFAKRAATGAGLLGAIVTVRAVREAALRSGRTAKICLTKTPERGGFSNEALISADQEVAKLNAARSSKLQPAVPKYRAPRHLLKPSPQ